MKRFPVNKKIEDVPHFIGLPLNLGYLYVGGSLILFFILLLLFSLMTLCIIAALDIMLYVLLSLLSSAGYQNIKKNVFSQKIVVIKNNSLEPFKGDTENS